jgi:uncharacterized protein YxeA
MKKLLLIIIAAIFTAIIASKYISKTADSKKEPEVINSSPNNSMQANPDKNSEDLEESIEE